jgi:EAL domain-containing protein (putative c-di-GMP-specific phosphodiesterase class I)
VLKEAGLAASCLRLDVPESVILESNGSAADAFAELRDMGVGIQVDHFSLGFTSLSYLSHFPTSTLKIDRSFIKHMTQDSNQSKIAQSILALTHELGIEAVAEGLETEGQLAQLKALGCEYGQGSIVCGPVDSNAIRPLLSKTMAGQNPFLSWKIGVLSR